MRNVLLVLALLLIPSTSSALTRSEAVACISEDLNALIAGRSIEHKIDYDRAVPKALGPAYRNLTNEKRNFVLTQARLAVRQEIEANRGHYGAGTVASMSNPEAVRGGYFKVYGSLVVDGSSYDYSVFLKRERGECIYYQVRLSIFSLTSWIKDHPDIQMSIARK